MSTQRYSVTPHPIETLLTWVKSGEIAIPEIQRPFVWELNPQPKVMRWQFDLPLRRNTDFTWVRHFIYSLAPHDTSVFIAATL